MKDHFIVIFFHGNEANNIRNIEKMQMREPVNLMKDKRGRKN